MAGCAGQAISGEQSASASVASFGYGGPALLSVQGAVSAASVDSEPNETRADATVVPVDTSLSATLEANGLDWFAFDITDSGEFSVDFTRSNAEGVTAVVLVDSEGMFLNQLYVGSDDPVSVYAKADGPDTYFAQIVDIEEGDGDYSFTVASGTTSSTPTPTPTPTETPTPTPSPTPTPTPTETPTPTPSPTPTPTPTETPTPTPAPEPASETWIEAESAANGNNFAPFEIRTDEGASGGEYITTADEGRNNYGGLPEAGRARYEFTVPESGEYYVWGRIGAKSNGNSFYLVVNGGEAREWHADIGGWHWEQPLTVSLGAGTHSFAVAPREDGAKLDRFVVTADADFEPSGTGEPEESSTLTPTPEETTTPAPTTATPTPTPTTPIAGGDSEYGDQSYGELGFGGTP
ncbi:fibronectin type III domain-containing protein [Halogeometricum pallidum JCM 14848]|uniref:Fibronectin type III domain-containing protein n=1 Tax=Halogeometricum pallidum JCM 14848 TaxID=1227487 RepID=M0DAW5_HALPD|nr:fibronectin type III domain-containing protein [Halogeometricum pallidum]ELZ31324.1 fibronectin type III domain-containing protein [Halogeometricum pallidum JCM 14848]